MSAMVSQITCVSSVCSTDWLGIDEKISKLGVTGLCERNPLLADGFPSQRASNAENVSIWWRHRECPLEIVETEAEDHEQCLSLLAQLSEAYVLRDPIDNLSNQWKWSFNRAKRTQ